MEKCQEPEYMHGSECMAPKAWRVSGLQPYVGTKTFKVEQIVHVFDLDYFIDRIKVKEVPGDKTYWVDQYAYLFEMSPTQ